MIKKISAFFFVVFFFAAGFLYSQDEITTAYSGRNEIIISSVPAFENISATERKVDYSIRDTIDVFGNLYIRYHGFHPSVMTFVNNDGSVTICTSDIDAEKTYIYEYNQNMEEIKTLSFKNEPGTLGAFTKDDDGNYYFFYARHEKNKSAKNMAVVKYGTEGEKLKDYILIANAPNSFGGVRVPFDAGTCRMELSGELLCVYFAREMFNGHQASFGIVLNKDTFEKVDRGIVDNSGYSQRGNNVMPYVSHSFNQFILPVENGFVFADHGDAYPRCFTFAKLINGKPTKELKAFKFPGAAGANATYAEFGGLAKTGAGFLFAGTYGKDRNGARNVFVFIIDEELNKCSEPLYLTKYTKNDGHAGHPKIVSIDNGNYLLLWEFFSYSTQAANILASGLTGYLSTFALVINEEGKAVSEVKEFKGIRLNINDTLRYNPKTKKVYWAINSTNKAIVIFALDAGLGDY